MHLSDSLFENSSNCTCDFSLYLPGALCWRHLQTRTAAVLIGLPIRLGMYNVILPCLLRNPPVLAILRTASTVILTSSHIFGSASTSSFSVTSVDLETSTRLWHLGETKTTRYIYRESSVEADSLVLPIACNFMGRACPQPDL